ncbi:hypothetical protein B0G80_5958 [Paraburkholderia sp. BL6669N2]|nr:hypothetical protein B0G80_5958 [Paraburkholderia sp. BL6669N2]
MAFRIVTAIGVLFAFSRTMIPTLSLRCLAVTGTVSQMKNSSHSVRGGGDAGRASRSLVVARTISIRRCKVLTYFENTAREKKR